LPEFVDLTADQGVMFQQHDRLCYATEGFDRSKRILIHQEAVKAFLLVSLEL
jgi:hypothetical protein